MCDSTTFDNEDQSHLAPMLPAGSRWCSFSRVIDCRRNDVDSIFLTVYAKFEFQPALTLGIDSKVSVMSALDKDKCIISKTERT
jgi:hypothetical protein